MGRTLLFCLLWVATNYLLIRSLRALACTDVIALYSTNVAFVYLLSWVILHEQFVGVRVSYHATDTLSLLGHTYCDQLCLVHTGYATCIVQTIIR